MALVLGLLLAVGLGALGGRPAPSPTTPALALGSQPAPTPSPAELVTLVTPAVGCIPLPIGALPEIRLDALSAGGIYPGDVEIQGWSQPGPKPTAPVVPPDQRPTPERLALRPDVAVSLRTTDDTCATAWAITLDDGRGEIELERFASPASNPEYARQNWFTLDLAPYRGQEYTLGATLEFPGVSTRTTWPIAVASFDTPQPRLTQGKRSVEVVLGCNIELMLGTGYSEIVNGCSEDLGRIPELARLVAPGPPLLLEFPKDWYLEGAGVSCGSIKDFRFQPDQTGECNISSNDNGVSMSIGIGHVSGKWTLAVSGCVTQLLSDVTNRACGNWYATIAADRLPR